MPSIPSTDLRRHAPEAPDPYWQESFFLAWYDARSRCAGHHHISFCPYERLAHVWSFISVDGRVVARSQENAIPLPDGDLDDVTVGVLRFTSGDGGRTVGLTVSGAVEVSIAYTAFTDPLTLDFNTGGLQLGKGHYESMGWVTGSVTLEGRSIAVTGSGWQDHSWGPRKLGSHKSGRYFWAVFGDDLAFSVYGMDDANGQNRFGYVLENGVIHPVTGASFGAGVADDGASPVSLDARVFTARRGWHVTGTADANALVGGAGWADGGDFFGMNGLMRYECGGRLGEGLFELTELRSPLARHVTELNLKSG
jgi:hypothetical protein